MTTLVIHPYDPSTAFLGVIYLNKGWTVISTPTSKKFLKQAIKQHERIIILGHGSDKGLFGFGRFVIDSTWVYSLRNKSIVCIWCNSDLFVKKYNLRGFYTGMIISDHEEAIFYCVANHGSQIEDSNKLFAEAMTAAMDSNDRLTTALSIYKDDTNPIIEFNRKNIYESF